MSDRRLAIYHAWSKPDEVTAPLEIIENRFPTLFESRRMLYPRFEHLMDPARFDQGIAGFLDHIMRQNFAAFVSLARTITGHPVVEIERVDDDGGLTALLARQKIDLKAPPHLFTANGRTSFDALLQSRPQTFAGALLVGDATLWSSTAGGTDSLHTFWTNVLQRPHQT